MAKSNPISQTKRFKPGQVVRVTFDCGYDTAMGRIREVEKGEEDWKYYVNYNGRRPLGQTSGLHFAEELTSI